MEICPIQDLELEKLLIELRKGLLLALGDKKSTLNLIKFQNALALQCFTNEYIYNETDKETAAVRCLEKSIEECTEGGRTPDPYEVVCLASYRPLFSYEWAQKLLDIETLSAVVKRQIVDNNEENKIRKTIKIVSPIKNAVSLKVRGQYEDSPYPRWVNTKLINPSMTIGDVFKLGQLRALVKSNKVVLPDAPEVLVAGCGTGQHALSVATRFKDCRVTAIDLSLNSLSYAKRKTEQLAITNIDYFQADILDVCKMEKQFDVIESVGVLHHMEDPIKGWRALTESLKPNGIMRIGLYSRLARQNIIETRKILSNTEFPPSRMETIELRQKIIHGSYPEVYNLSKAHDFYSLSTFRDLLLHVQEHTFTLPDLKETIETLGLTFCGFEFQDTRILNLFRKENLRPDDIYDLDTWHQFEKQNPSTFSGMYQFWVQLNS